MLQLVSLKATMRKMHNCICYKQEQPESEESLVFIEYLLKVTGLKLQEVFLDNVIFSGNVWFFGTILLCHNNPSAWMRTRWDGCVSWDRWSQLQAHEFHAQTKFGIVKMKLSFCQRCDGTFEFISCHSGVSHGRVQNYEYPKEILHCQEEF